MLGGSPVPEVGRDCDAETVEVSGRGWAAGDGVTAGNVALLEPAAFRWRLTGVSDKGLWSPARRSSSRVAPLTTLSEKFGTATATCLPDRKLGLSAFACSSCLIVRCPSEHGRQHYSTTPSTFACGNTKEMPVGR